VGSHYTVSCTSFVVATSTATENMGASNSDHRCVVLAKPPEPDRYIDAPGDSAAPSALANWVAVPAETMVERTPDRFIKIKPNTTKVPELNAVEFCIVMWSVIN
jgi:hypothetical protein